MSATETAPESGSSQQARDAGATSQQPFSNDTPESPLSELDDIVERGLQDGLTPANGNAAEVKMEVDEAAEDELNNTTATTLRPDPAPSMKRRESEVAMYEPDFQDQSNNRKRKRGPSPPWQFPSTELSTLKTADGRRISARFNASTPTLSENDAAARGRSSSLSAPPRASLPLPGSGKIRAASPPWKRFGAEGPTAVVVDGKRKSGRVNKELSSPPKRVSPRSKDKQGGARHGPVSAGKGAEKGKKVGVQTQQNSIRPGSSRPSSSHADSLSKIAELRAQIEALKPTHSFPSPEQTKRSHKRKSSYELNEPTSPPPTHRKHPRPSIGAASPETQRPSPRIKLRFTPGRKVVAPPHPNSIFPLPTLPPRLSIFQRIEGFELKDLQAPYTENERGPPDMVWFNQRAERLAAEEGVMRRRLLEEAKPGGKLSKEHLSILQDAEPQTEPPKQYDHPDHLVAHLLHLRHLQQREKAQHKQLAKKVAHEALEFWKAKRGPTEEDLREEADRIFRLIYKQVVVDVKAKWDMVGSYVQQSKLEAWNHEQEIQRQVRLREKLEKSEHMFAKLRGEVGSDEEDVQGVSDDESESSEEENMSGTSSEDGEGGDGEGGELGEDELKAYLAQRESEQPNTVDVDRPEDAEREDQDVSMAELLHPDAVAEDVRSENMQDVSMTDLLADETLRAGQADANQETEAESQDGAPNPGHEDIGNVELEEVDFSSDESTNMDSTDYDSDEDMSSTGDEDNENADNDDATDEDAASGDEKPIPKDSLLSLFKDEVKRVDGLPTPTTSAEGDERDKEGVAEDHRTEVEIQAHAGAVVDPEANPDDTVMHDEDREPTSNVEEPAAPASPSADSQSDTADASQLVPQPALLRGTLRSYQHAGLDWLASLYRNDTNGILADEMGLGKTIQTIALLGHLAEVHEVWDPHLVIVPTSVILNWVTEFQKFLPGFRVLGYYGTADERQAKRRGWVNDPHHEIRDKRGYNVVITSYNVAMQDFNAIRNVSWHYLVLDEAHNIRNFNTARWQHLIRLRSQARLLLTGTPLQNSLTELWSLLTFLTAGDDDPAHGDLEEFLSHWKDPVKEIFDRGVQSLSSEAQKVVDQLHVSLRPFLLRRLKSEVEKDLPKKTESVVVCKLSKRQRQLYQEYMGLAETRRSLTQGNAVSAGRVLLSLRRVCNHPDLFDPRPIQTSFAMESSVAETFSAVEDVVRRLLGVREDVHGSLVIVSNEDKRKYALRRSGQLSATARLDKELQAEEANVKSLSDSQLDASTISGSQALQKLRLRQQKLQQLRSGIQTSKDSLRATPVYGSDLRELVTLKTGRTYRIVAKDVRGRVLARPLRGWPALGRHPLKFDMDHVSDWMLSKTSLLQESVQTHDKYAERLQDTIVRFAFCTPAVTAPVLNYAIPERAQQLIRASTMYPAESDYAQEARTRTAIAFPDSRLLIYDSGKLQRLTRLLRDLQSRGSRSLIFTQMTGTLNILEQFLSLLNLPYLRLDGSTPVERRQLYSAEFNRPDSKYQCMILSSRAGGIGLNLTGASSVIFYDLDWNPQMDRQCMDRAHRIGQVRDVEVYKMVSEKTVEENILRRAEQKSLLDQTVIQEGHFTTEYQQQRHAPHHADGEEDEDVAAAIERFLGGVGNEKATTQAIESVEDKEDVQAAHQARKEEVQADDVDFAADRSSKGPSGRATPGHIAGDDEDEERKGHVDNYMIKLMERLLKDVPFVPPQVRKTDRHGRDPSHRKKKR